MIGITNTISAPRAATAQDMGHEPCYVEIAGTGVVDIKNMDAMPMYAGDIARLAPLCGKRIYPGTDKISDMSGDKLVTLGMKININKAGREDLMAVPGIGPVRSNRILDRREELGSFSGFEQLKEIKGIYGVGWKKYFKLQEREVMER